MAADSVRERIESLRLVATSTERSFVSNTRKRRHGRRTHADVDAISMAASTPNGHDETRWSNLPDRDRVALARRKRGVDRFPRRVVLPDSLDRDVDSVENARQHLAEDGSIADALDGHAARHVVAQRRQHEQRSSNGLRPTYCRMVALPIWAATLTFRWGYPVMGATDGVVPFPLRRLVHIDVR